MVLAIGEGEIISGLSKGCPRLRDDVKGIAGLGVLLQKDNLPKKKQSVHVVDITIS